MPTSRLTRQATRTNARASIGPQCPALCGHRELPHMNRRRVAAAGAWWCPRAMKASLMVLGLALAGCGGIDQRMGGNWQGPVVFVFGELPPLHFTSGLHVDV